ncbi:hypothetical protein FACS1894187_01420 [Synergistales bacterium]|nr:hypothetical protein FACS1894187_01420 [Synergistales bacterium]
MSVIFGITGASYLGKIGSNFESEEELHGTREELCKMIIDNAVRQVGKVKPTCHWRVEILGIFDWNSVYTINSEIVDIRKEMIRSLGSKAFGKNITKSEMDRFHVGGEFWGRTRSQVEASASADTEDIGRKACEYFSANRTRDVKASKYFSANR